MGLRSGLYAGSGRRQPGGELLEEPGRVLTVAAALIPDEALTVPEVVKRDEKCPSLPLPFLVPAQMVVAHSPTVQKL
jgi:hypothetical protein